MKGVFDVRKKYASKRQILDFNSLADKFGSWVVLCAPEAAVLAARELLSERGMWLSSYATSWGEHYYDAPSTDDFRPMAEAIAEFVEATHDMSFCESIVDSLEEIAGSIRQSSCCGDGGPGLQEIGGNPYYGDEEPLDAPTSFGGPGDEFDDQTEYDEHRCAAANAIVDGAIATLNNWALMSVGGLTAAGILVAIAFLYFTAPPLAVFLTLAALGFAFAGFSEIADEIDANRNDLVCGLYNSTSATNAYDTYHDAVESLVIGLGYLEVEVATIMDIFKRLGSIDAMNALYRSVGLPEVANPVDCSGCDQIEWSISLGSLSNGSLFGPQFTVSSEPVASDCGTTHQIALQLPNGECAVVDISTSGYSESCINNDNWFFRCNGNFDLIQGGSWAGTYIGECIGGEPGQSDIMIRSGSSFSVTVSFRPAEAGECTGGP